MNCLEVSARLMGEIKTGRILRFVLFLYVVVISIQSWNYSITSSLFKPIPDTFDGFEERCVTS
jgi:hypothetical protein